MSVIPAKECFLSCPPEFSEVARRGTRKSGKFLSAAGLSNHAEYAKLGVVLKKRHIRNATLRNRLRRVLRESFRQQWCATLPPFNFLILSKSPLTKVKAKVNEGEVREECLRLLQGFGKTL